MVHEKRLIDLGSNVLRVTKMGCLTKLPGTRPDDFSSLNYKDLGEFNIRLDFLIAEDSGDNYSIPAKSVSVSLNTEQQKQLFELLQPTAVTAVGGPSGARTVEDTARAVVDRLFRSIAHSTWAESWRPGAFEALKRYGKDMELDVLKVLKGEL